MSVFVQSLKRLYLSGRVTIEQVAERVESGKITAEDYTYITGEAYE
jgi:uncharacterized XkdX family phage protein